MTEVDDPNMASAFDLSLKKKKKKKTTKTDDKVEEATDEIEKLEVSEKPSKKEAKKEEKDEDAEDGDADPSLDLSGKKKKKKKVTIDPVPQDEPEAGSDEEESSNGTSAVSGDGKLPWDGSDRDYSYEELASRIYDLLHNNNPELGSKQKRYVMKPPQVCREGTKRTVWINFTEMSQIMKRKPEHVLNYVLAELGTNGSVDGSHRLVIKGRFQPKQIENVIRHYIAEYVACRTCKSPDTILKKDNRLYFLCCEACGSTRSVATIKKGYEAQIGKRKKEMT